MIAPDFAVAAVAFRFKVAIIIVFRLHRKLINFPSLFFSKFLILWHRNRSFQVLSHRNYNPMSAQLSSKLIYYFHFDYFSCSDIYFKTFS